MNQMPGNEGKTGASYEASEVEEIKKRIALLKKINRIIWFLFAVLEVIIGLRVILKLLGADPLNAFASFIYDIAYPFLVPFFGIVGEPTTSGGSVLEVSSIIAMVVYLLIAWGITRLLTLILTPADADRLLPGGS
jgi:hypothetical protein